MKKFEHLDHHSSKKLPAWLGLFDLSARDIFENKLTNCKPSQFKLTCRLKPIRIVALKPAISCY